MAPKVEGLRARSLSSDVAADDRPGRGRLELLLALVEARPWAVFPRYVWSCSEASAAGAAAAAAGAEAALGLLGSASGSRGLAAA
mmetsp:Transcript_118950/g.384096  ORF Transcript_118950/g.384096 Transcript_118950/m.384096 type:complete len:85 (-) Transcript_118950:2141-2395(-)